MKGILKFVLLGILGSSMNVYAANIEKNLNVTSNIEKTCKVIVSDVNFGNYQPEIAVISKASGKINLICNRAVSFKLGVDRFPTNAPYFYNLNSPLAFSETNSTPAMLNNANPPTAPMVSSKNALIYQMYTDSAHSVVWTGFTNHYITYGDNHKILGTGTGASVEIPFYASLDKNQYVTPGRYSAIMTLTVQF
jgi:hypothetical protein